MADGLGLAASIIAVLQITTSVASLSYQYLNSAIRAPDSLRELTLEFQTLIVILSRLKICAQDPQAETLRTVEYSLHVCHKEMLGLQEKLKPRKNLLGWLRWPLDEKDIQGYLGRIERFKSSFSLALEAEQLSRTNLVAESVQKMEIEIGDISSTKNCQEEREKDQTRRDALNWLFPAPYDKRHIEISSQRKKNTGQWIFKTQEVQDWIKGNPSGRLLWGYGIPGAGKTFLSSLMIDHIEAINANYGVGYIYFNFQEQGEQTPIDTFSSLVKQLAFKAKVLPKAIQEAYKDNKKPRLDQLREILLEIGKSFAQTFIIFDALDECDKVLQRETLLPIFHRIGKAGINLFLTSREHPDDIQASFANITKLRLWAKNDDISSYIEQRIADSSRAKSLINQGNPELKEKIISALQECANGMFLLVHFHIECLCQQTNLKQVLTELERIKNSSNEDYPMDPTYRRAMQNIHLQQKSGIKLAFKIISWLIKARRVLTVRELQLAVSVEEQNTIFDKDSLPDRKTLLDVCASLVSIDETSDCVRFVHYTAQEFLTRNQLVPDDADLQVAIACTTFLSYDIFSHRFHALYALSSSCTYPLLEYAASELQHHLKQCDELLTEEVISRLIQGKRNTRNYMYLATLKLDPSLYEEYAADKCGGELGVAAFLGNSSVIRRLLEQKDEHPSKLNLQWSLLWAADRGNFSSVQLLLEIGADVNFKVGDLRCTALHQAAFRGYEAIVKLLLENGADPNICDGVGRTPLLEQVMGRCKGSKAISKLLLENGADPNAQSRSGKLALHLAVNKCGEAMVKLLLENGADPNAQSRSGNLALHLAVNKCGEAMVKLLLENGADPNAQNESGDLALHLATDIGDEPMVKLLLENGADAHSHDRSGRTALYQAVHGGKETIIKLLLENGADAGVNTQDPNGDTLLYMAIDKGNEAIVTLLLGHGANANADDNFGRTALHLAASRGDGAMVMLLLVHGADAKAQNKSGNTVLHLATGGGEAMVKLLLENGVDANTQNESGSTALHLATGIGDEAMVKLLLENGADANTQNKFGNTALHLATGIGDEAMVKLLLENGAEVNTHDKYGDTALYMAIDRGNEAIVKLLFESGADIKFKSLRGHTALYLAVCGGHEAIVKLLLENGADANTHDPDGDTVLYVAMDKGNGAVVKLLLEYGADPNAQNKSGSTALHLATGESNEVMVKLLLEYGADARAQGRFRISPLNWAEINGNKVIIELLKNSINT